MNGPFFSERGIVPLFFSLLFPRYSVTRRSLTHWARRIRRNPRTGPGTRCDTGQNGQTKRVPWALGVFSTITAQPALHNRYITCGWGMTTFSLRAGLAAGRRRLETRAARRRDAPRVVRVTLIAPLSIPRRAGNMYCVSPLCNFVPQKKSLRLAPLNKQTNRRLPLARLRAQSGKAPRRLRMVALHAAFPAAVGMIHRIHRDAANRGPASMPARAARLAVGDVFMVQIAELADGSHALERKLPRFPGRQLDESNIALLAEQLRRAAGGTHELAALAGRHLEIVNHGAGRNIADRQRVAREDVGGLAVLHGHADFESHGMQDVTLLAIGIMQKGDARRAVRVVFDGGDLRRDAGFFAAEINAAVIFLVAAAAMPGRDFAEGFAPAGALFRLDERLLRLLLGDLALIEHGQE